MSAKYKSPSFLLPNELNTSANPANDTGINSLYSMDFAANRYIDTGDAFTSLTSFSVSAWFKSDNTAASAQAIVSSRINSIATSQGLDLNISVNAIYVRVFNNGATEVTTSFTDTTSWHHIVMTYNGTTLEMYLDGVSQGTATGVYTNSAANWLIGKWNAGSNYFDGKIDEVAIFNRALESTEIAALYGGTSPNIYPSNLMATDLNPLAYYPLGEQAQNTGYLDPSNPGNDIAGSEWQFPNGVLQDYVMDFDGTDNINSEANISSASSFTASIWINRDDSATQYVYGQWVDGTTASQSWVIQTVGGIVYFNVRNSSLAVSSAISTTSLTTGIWYNIIAVWTGSNIKLYINNSLEDTAACSSMNNPSTAVKLAIGSSSNNVSPFNGKISNAVIWNSDQESNRDNIYNNGSPQTIYTVTPQNWWKLNADSVYTPSAPNYTKVLEFNGTSSTYIDLNNITSLNGVSQASYSFWFKLTSSTPASGSTSVMLIGSNAKGASCYYYNTTFYIHNLNTKFISTAQPSLNNWHHVCCVFNSGVAEAYVDGISVGTVTEPTLTTTASDFGNNFNIGYSSFYSAWINNGGQISNLALFNSALSSSQVSTLFNFGTPENNISFSPQAWWKLDDQTAITDSSGNGNTGTNNGATNATTSVAVVPSWKIPSALPITTTPNYTTALEFNYKDSIGFGNSIGNLIGDNYTGGLSFSFWINPSATNSDDGVFNFSGNTISFVVRSNSFRLYSSSCTSGQCFSYNYTNPSNEWSHCVISFLPSGSSFYLNGESVATWTYTDLNINGKDFYIGWYYSINYYYIGKLSNFQIWNTNLSSTEASTLYNGGTPIAALSGIPQSSNLISWWKLNDSGSTIIDSAGNNNGSYTFNSATLVASDVLTHQPSNGVSTTLPSTALQQSDLQFDSPYSNYSLSFDGSTSFIDCTDNDMFSFGDGANDSPFSVSAWIKVGDTDINRIVNKVGGSDAEWLFSTGTNNRTLVLNLYSSGATISGPNRGVAGSTSLNSYLNQWVHVACSYDGRGGNTAYDGMKLYFNGQLETTTNLTAGTYVAMTNGVAPLRIGSDIYFTNYYFNGKIDETAIFNTELTSAQVLEIYNNGRPKDLTTFSGTAPISWWRLGENAYFDNNSFVVPNSITGAPNGTGSGTITTMISADAPGTYANGIGTNLDILDRVGDAPLSTSNSQSYNMIPSDISPYVPEYVGKQIANNFSMSFDGTNYFTASSKFDFIQQTGIFSISTWIKMSDNTSATNQVIAGTNYTGSNVGWQLWIDNRSSQSPAVNKTLKFHLWNSSTNLLAIDQVITDNDWNLITITGDGTTIRAYKNGSLLSTTQSISGSTSSIAFSDLRIGANTVSSPSVFFNGQIDEVAIFDKALTADQIKLDLYQPSFPAGTNQTADIANNPNLPTPVAWYRMGD